MIPPGPWTSRFDIKNNKVDGTEIKVWEIMCFLKGLVLPLPSAIH